jgi:hypothetical protein
MDKIRVGVIGSMQFTEQMIVCRDELISLGLEAYVTDLAVPFIGKSDDEKEAIKIDQKMNVDAMREFWRKMQGGDAVLALNLDKKGVVNYIGANTFAEITWAHVLGQHIFLYNPMPEQQYIRTELEAMRPIIIERDLSKIRSYYQ